MVDLSAIKKVELNADSTITSVGAGAKWTDVYTYLDSKSLAVSGGRAAQVGVGGLTLGGLLHAFDDLHFKCIANGTPGGLSYFSARKGFVCDNVANYEIVLADGKIVSGCGQYQYPPAYQSCQQPSENSTSQTRSRMIYHSSS